MKNEPSVSKLLENGLAYHQQGDLANAEIIYRKALSLDPANADALHLLGIISCIAGHPTDGIQLIAQAIKNSPETVIFYNSIGNAYAASGELDRAVDYFLKAIELQPLYEDPAAALLSLKLDESRELSILKRLEVTLNKNEGSFLSYKLLANILRKQGRAKEAVLYYIRALEKNRMDPEVLNNLGLSYYEAGEDEKSESCYREALQIVPRSIEVMNNLGVCLAASGKLQEATSVYETALNLSPDSPEILKNLGSIRYDKNEFNQAMEAYVQSYTKRPCDGLKIKIATAIPIIPSSLEELNESRNNLTRNIDALLQQNLRVSDPYREVGSTNFYLAYQGKNDVKLQTDIAQIHLRACSELNFTAPHCSGTNIAAGEKIRIGFISRYFTGNHIINRMANGIISNLSREEFTVTVFHFQPLSVHIAEHLKDQDKSISLPLNLRKARDLIASERLDILFYTDIGMDAFTYFLAFSRLAKIQCTTGGHPVTTGIPNMDLFISNEWDEIESAQDHYSEKLVLLKNRAVFYMPSRVPSNNVTRDYFSLPADAHIYLCPMSPYKFHPEFDSILGEILERDPLAQIVIVNHETYKFLYKAVLERLNRTIPNVINRIRIVPRQSVSDFLQLLRLSDVLLDTIHFGGGTTCLESMLVGTPVISMPGEFLRSRGTQAFYKQMGITENLASNREEYIQMALRMAEDRDLNQSLRSTILEHNHVLYEDLSGVKDLEQFFLGLANRI